MLAADPARSSRPEAPASNASAAARSASSASAVSTRRSAKRAPNLRSSLSSARPSRLRLAALLAAAILPAGCYYTHIAAGQARILLARQPIEELLASPETPVDLAERLRLAGEVRGFAKSLGLEVGRQYTSYVAWPGDRVVTTVVATRPGEIDAAGFWFPIVGHVPYKGYFDPALAEREAARLGARGLDTCLFPILAFSTLGWFADPLTAPLAASPRLPETLIHELVHATAYVASEPDFDEGIATFIGQEGAVRFAEAHSGADAAERERLRVQEDRRVAAALQALRERVQALYASAPAGPERDAARLQLERDARAEIAAMPLVVHDAKRISGAVRLNDACQALIGTYQADLPRYALVLDALGGDLPRFVARFREAAKQPDPHAAMLEGAPGDRGLP